MPRAGGLASPARPFSPAADRDEAVENHADALRAAVSAPEPTDARGRAEILARVYVSLLALAPVIRAGTAAPRLPALPDWLERALRDTSVDSLYYLAGGADRAGMQALYQRIADAQLAFAGDVTAVLRADGIAPLIYKGTELRPRLLGGAAMSTSTDVDVLVTPDQLERARLSLRAQGFRHAEYDPNTGELWELAPEQVAAHEARHRETYPLCRLVPFALDAAELALVETIDLTPVFAWRGEGRLLQVVDLHHSLFARMEVHSLFSRAGNGAVPGALTLSAADHLWTTALRFYLESNVAHADPKHRDLFYMAALLDAGGIDWDLLVRIVAEADLRPSCFYTLRMLAALGIGSAPPEVLDALHVRHGSPMMDFGCRASRSLGLVEPVHPALCPTGRGG